MLNSQLMIWILKSSVNWGDIIQVLTGNKLDKGGLPWAQSYQQKTIS